MAFVTYLIGLLAAVSGVAVVYFRNPIFSALSLVVNLLMVAGLYATLNAHFLAVAQIVVYAGAIMVLVLFVLMLLNVQAESKRGARPATLVFSGLAALLFMLLVIPIISDTFSNVAPAVLEANEIHNVGSVKNIGELLYTRYMLPFELASLIIMVGIVGAVMLAKRESQLPQKETHGTN